MRGLELVVAINVTSFSPGLRAIAEGTSDVEITTNRASISGLVYFKILPLQITVW